MSSDKSFKNIGIVQLNNSSDWPAFINGVKNWVARQTPGFKGVFTNEYYDSKHEDYDKRMRNSAKVSAASGATLECSGIYASLELSANAPTGLLIYILDSFLMAPSLAPARPAVGLHLNATKQEFFWPAVGGFLLLGSAFRQASLRSRILKTLVLLERLPEFADPQIQLLLLRSCLGVQKLAYALRTTPPALLLPLLTSLMGPSIPLSPTLLLFELATLPLRSGGLGVSAAADLAVFAYLASTQQTSALQSSLLVSRPSPHCPLVTQLLHTSAFLFGFPSSADLHTAIVASPKPQHFLATMFYESKFKRLLDHPFVFASPRHRALLHSLATSHAPDFWLTLPIAGLGQVMTPSEFRAVARYRLLIPFFPIPPPSGPAPPPRLCPMPSCRSPLDAFW
ncbi:hypothetical protein BC829DRAFT_440846 [Chytridium lagenaria]|nr:hypothetical protein BC829DRAFT_440846 [Chytridium lagenaria]